MSVYKATLMDEEAVRRALKRISHEIIEKNSGSKNICLVGIKRRGVPIAEIIANHIFEIEGIKPPVGQVDIKYYRDDLSRIGDNPRISDDNIGFDINNKTVVLVDDVLFTGRTVRAAMEAVISRGRPSGIQLVVLVDRGHRELPIRGDYIGKNVPTSRTEHIEVKMPPYEERMAVELYG